jgi:hypothetical protein
MIASFTKTLGRAGLVLAAAASFASRSSTSSFAFRLCSFEIPNIPKITACMIKHRADLSAGCRTVMDRDLAEKSSAVAAQ